MADVAEFRDFRLVDSHQAWRPGGPVASRLPDPEIDVLEGRATATIGEPSTLGLWGFATGTWIAGAVFGGLVSGTAQPALGVVLLLFAGIAQFIAGLYAFRRVNTLAASAFCCFGAYNTVIGLMLLAAASGLIQNTAGTLDVMAWFNFSFGFIALALCIAAFSRNMVLTGVLFFLACGYTLIGITLLTGGGAVGTAGAATLFLSALLAYYLGMALVVNSSWRRTILPVLGEA